MISFSMQARLTNDLATFLELARKSEDLGYGSFMVPDHPGSVPNPFVSLAAAASVTSSIALGPYVLNAGVRDPFSIAVDTASLDTVSGGRAFLGMGAGHTPAEWAAVGHERPSASDRAGRMIEMTTLIQRLLGGETVTHDGKYVSMTDASLLEPPGNTVRTLVGGGNTALLDFAGQHADVMGLSGLGRTLEDGHRHEVRWSHNEIQAQVDRVAAAGRSVELEALVQRVTITNDREAAIEDLADLDMSPTDLLDTPYMLIGSLDQIEDQLLRHKEQWGITRYALRTDALEAMAPLVAKFR